jgi:hypothetical protein
MRFEEFFESAVAIWSRSGTKNVRKYRCSSGQRKGQVVSSPSTCTKPKNVKASRNLKTTKQRKGSIIKVKRARTLRANPSSKRLSTLNKSSRRKVAPKTKARKI